MLKPDLAGMPLAFAHTLQKDVSIYTYFTLFQNNLGSLHVFVTFLKSNSTYLEPA